ncbi:brassinosteroid-responsive RING protein 1-like [Zingiber officinale]|nr:brassinosteroid-responsive RING protein 1-like [Zingiber officinale]
MGFPVGGYSELLLPRTLLGLTLLLGYLRRLVSDAFSACLGVLLLDDGLRVRRRQSTALAVDRALPATRYDGDCDGRGSGCAICLCEFEQGEAVRKLSDCRHVFHRGCLDRWVEHGRSTCPLCRAPLFSDLAWDAAPHAYHDDDCDDFAPTTRAMLLLDQLFSASWFNSAADYALDRDLLEPTNLSL